MIYICYTHYVLICIVHSKYQYLSTVEIAGEFGRYGECMPLCSSGVNVKNLSHFVRLLAVRKRPKIGFQDLCRFNGVSQAERLAVSLGSILKRVMMKF